uniref:Uncharacterized protein n=1 Tax=Monopterus albus TaxID=43700 RepID=A0A3Q3IAH9_MONAL
MSKRVLQPYDCLSNIVTLKKFGTKLIKHTDGRVPEIPALRLYLVDYNMTRNPSSGHLCHIYIHCKRKH